MPPSFVRLSVLILVIVAALLGARLAEAAGRVPPETIAAVDGRLSAAIAAGQIPAAAATAETAITLRRRVAAAPLAAASFLDTLGLRFFAAGTPESWQAASGYFERALALREKALGRDHVDVAKTLGNLSAVYDYQGRWPEALVLEQRALVIRTRPPGGGPTVAASLRHVGLLLYQLGRYAEAEPMLARALAVYDSLGSRHVGEVVDGLNNLGEVSRVQDHYRDAESSFSRGLEVARGGLPAEDGRRLALLNNLAGLYKDLGRYDEAEPLLLEFLGQVEKASPPDHEMLATANLNLAEVYRLQGRLAEAEPLYARALDMARASLPAGSPDLVPFISQAAVVDHALGRLDQAEALYRESVGTTERALGPGHPMLAQSLHDLAGLLSARGQFAAAEEAYRRALAIREASLGPRHPEGAQTLVELARCLAADPAAGDSAAGPVLERAIAVLDSATAYPEARLDAYALRARLRARSGRLDAAIADMTEALAAVDVLRPRRGGGEATRATFVATHLDLFDQMLAWRLDQGDIARALDAHERARARVLLDQLAAGSVDLKAGIPPDVRAPLEAGELAARERLARQQRRLQDTRMRGDLTERARLEAVAEVEAGRDSAAWELQRAREAIRDRSPIWRDVLNASGQPASLSRIQRELVAPDELLLVYHTGAQASFLFVIPPAPHPPSFVALTLDSLAARELRVAAGPLTAGKVETIMAGAPGSPAMGTAAGLAALLERKGEEERVLVSQLQPGKAGLLERRLSALARVLMPRATWSTVRRASEVVIVPDGALHLLPFEALVITPRSAARGPRYWLDDGPAIRYGASATSLLSLTRRAGREPGRAGGARLLSVSNPAFDTSAAGRAGGWARLPGTARESEAIRRAFAPESVVVLEGAAASEGQVRAELPARRYLHFATHGFVTESRSDVLAGLALTRPKGGETRSEDDGLLQLYEIYELPLDCDLAVLSACETQRGPRVAGEGVFALSRGFLAAGARRAIASLWAVDDASTAALIGECFALVAAAERAGRTPNFAAALRDAQRRVRAQARWADPFYWAPFVLAGVR